MATRLEPAAGTLYLIATPIGNLEDITLRALRLLREVDIIAAENARHTRALLSHFTIGTRVLSYREANKSSSIGTVLDSLQTGAVALVSDAGMPAISDPGAHLVRAALDNGYRVEAIPGANAAILAVVASGLPPAPFSFVGFLSRQRGDRKRQLATLASREETLVFYEAPHRVIETLTDMRTVLGDREAASCRELTKVHEEINRGTLSELLSHYMVARPRGEFTVVVSGATAVDVAEVGQSAAGIDMLLLEAMQDGEDMRAIIHSLAATTGQPRRLIYARWQDLRRVRRQS